MLLIGSTHLQSTQSLPKEAFFKVLIKWPAENCWDSLQMFGISQILQHNCFFLLPKSFHPPSVCLCATCPYWQSCACSPALKWLVGRKWKWYSPWWWLPWTRVWCRPSWSEGSCRSRWRFSPRLAGPSPPGCEGFHVGEFQLLYLYVFDSTVPKQSASPGPEQHTGAQGGRCWSWRSTQRGPPLHRDSPGCSRCWAREIRVTDQDERGGFYMEVLLENVQIEVQIQIHNLRDLTFEFSSRTAHSVDTARSLSWDWAMFLHLLMQWKRLQLTKSKVCLGNKWSDKMGKNATCDQKDHQESLTSQLQAENLTHLSLFLSALKMSQKSCSEMPQMLFRLTSFNSLSFFCSFSSTLMFRVTAAGKVI